MKTFIVQNMIALSIYALCGSTVFAVPPATRQASFLNYVPEARDFQQPLQALVQELRDAAELEAKKKKSGQEKLNSAIKTAERLLRESNRGYHDELYHLLGYGYELLGQNEQALDAYQRSLDLKANTPVVVFRRAYILRRENRCPEAVVELREVLWRTKQNSHEALFLTAECLLATGREAEALKLSQEAYQNDRLFLPVLRQLVVLREHLLPKEKDPAAAAGIESQIAADLSEIVRQDPHDRDAALKLSRLLLRQGDPLLAPEALKQAQALAGKFARESGYSDEQSVKLLFDAQVKQGQLDEAEKTLQTAQQALPESALLREARKQLDIQRGAAHTE